MVAAMKRCRRWLAGPLGLWLVLMMGPSGCEQRPRGPRPPEAFNLAPGTYDESQAGLQRFWQDVLTACQRDQRERVHDLLASLALTRGELAELVGPALAGELWTRYLAQMGSMANSGAVELVGFVYEKKLDEVAVMPVATAVPDGGVTAPGGSDPALLKALATPRSVYAVVLRKKPAEKGLRYGGLVYLSGRWRSAGPVAKLLSER